jgi:hypothetical protein
MVRVPPGGPLVRAAAAIGPPGVAGAPAAAARGALKALAASTTEMAAPVAATARASFRINCPFLPGKWDT